jgi:NADH:ubiquinone oxidoreductase subunit H
MQEKTPHLQRLADDLIRRAFDVDPATWPLTEIVYVGVMFAAAGLAFVFALHFAGLFIFFERRIAARMQSRVGPNRVGPNGVLQWAVDGVKCLFKEDLVPNGADQALFRMAPYFVVLGMVLSFACLPFSSALIPADLDIGLLFILGITSLVVIGVLMGGWGSNSKWALLGGMRAAAQVVSYEIPAAIAAMSVIIIGGTLSMQGLIHAQGGSELLPNWTIFHSPFTLIAFLIFFVAQLAEGNRTPFDLPEAESELVSGYNTEYSGMRFLMFFLGEFANVWVMAAISVTLFLGGWQIPFGTQADGVTPSEWVTQGSGAILAVMMVGAALPALAIAVGIFKYRKAAHDRIMAAQIPAERPQLWKLALRGAVDGAMVVHAIGGVALIALAFFQMTVDAPLWVAARTPIAINGLQLGIFAAKSLALVFVIIQLRWTLPRLRVDQMMTLCWKYLVPLSFICMVGVLVWELIIGAVPALNYAMRWAMLAAAIAIVAIYVKKIKATYDADKENWENFTGQPAYYPPWRLP